MRDDEVEVPLLAQGANQFFILSLGWDGLGKSDRSADASGVLITNSFLPSKKVRVWCLHHTQPKNVWRQTLQGRHSDSGRFFCYLFSFGRAAFAYY